MLRLKVMEPLVVRKVRYMLPLLYNGTGLAISNNLRSKVIHPRSAPNFYVVELIKKYYQAFICLLIVLWVHQRIVARQKRRN